MIGKTVSHDRAGWVPFGLGQTKPHHYLDILRTVWENRDNLRYAWRILRHGFCDGCALGPYGLRDNTMPGVHLYMTRLCLLRLSSMAALDHARLALRGGDRVRLRSDVGEFEGFCHVTDQAPGTLQAYWPEANVLLPTSVTPPAKSLITTRECL
jgi:hypothetical protein